MLHIIQEASQAFLCGSKDPRVAGKGKPQYASSFQICIQFALLSLAKASHTVKFGSSMRGLSKGFDKSRYEHISSYEEENLAFWQIFPPTELSLLVTAFPTKSN